MKIHHYLAVLFLAGMLSACGGAASSGPSAAPAAPMAANEASTGSMASGAAPEKASQPDAQLPAQAGLDRMVVKNATVALQVADLAKAETAVRDSVAQFGGYVVTSESYGTDDSSRIQITFRVPAARFDEALGGLQGLAQKVLSRTISGDDVTEEFVDLESRLRNLEATRDRLLSFLDKATKVEDALAVNQSLTDVQGQIEQIRGRMQFLKQNAALSTISVQLVPVTTTPIVDDGWQPLEVARRALQALVVVGQGLVNVLIVALVMTPLWLPLLLLVIWLVRRSRRNKAAPPTTPLAS